MLYSFYLTRTESNLFNNRQNLFYKGACKKTMKIGCMSYILFSRTPPPEMP